MSNSLFNHQDIIETILGQSIGLGLGSGNSRACKCESSGRGLEASSRERALAVRATLRRLVQQIAELDATLKELEDGAS